MAKIATLTPKGLREEKVVSVNYNFSTHTGAQGTYESSVFLPKGAQILGVEQKMTAAFNSIGAATVALKLECGATDYTVITATAFNNAAFTASKPVATALPNILTDDGYFVMTVAGEALSAGNYTWYIKYVL